MNKHGLRKVLTESHLGRNGPLFKNTSDLARQICDLDAGSGRNRKPSSVATLLSNVFSGNRLCSSELQKCIVDSVGSRIRNLCETERSRINTEVVRAVELHNEDRTETGNPDNGLADAELLFQRLSMPGALLIVEYRDQPRATPEAKHRCFAARAGRAVAAGLHFAMVQPFCADAYNVQNGRFHHTLAVRNFLQQLVLHTQQVYLAMLKAALDNRGTQTEEEIARRLILYERTTENSGCFVSGIQSKLFLAEIPAGDASGKYTEREVWEWIAGKDQDFFLQRDDSAMPVEVLSDQFLHITKFWIDGQRLPITNDEIEETVALWGEQLGAKLPPNLWKVFKTPRDALKMVEKGYGKKRA